MVKAGRTLAITGPSLRTWGNRDYLVKVPQLLCDRVGLESEPPNSWLPARMTPAWTSLSPRINQGHHQPRSLVWKHPGVLSQREEYTRKSWSQGPAEETAERERVCFTLTFCECRPQIPGLFLGTQRERRCWWTGPLGAGNSIWTNGKRIGAAKRAELRKGFLFVWTKQSNLSLDPFMAD